MSLRTLSICIALSLFPLGCAKYDSDKGTDSGEVSDTDTDTDGDGFTSEEDCDDTNPDIYPGATEICDEIDNNCDDQIDEGVTTTYYQDVDGDDFGDVASPVEACEKPSGYATNDTDCNDGDDDIYPSALEHCDGVDEDCDTVADNDAVDQATWYLDDDNDGYGDPDTATEACDAPSNYIADDNDCDDTDEFVNPNGSEIDCDGTDSDCDGYDGPSDDINSLAVGDLIITEVMQNPASVTDAKGEWFEIYNASNTEFDLDGLEIESGSTNSHTVSGCLDIEPGEYLVFATNGDSNVNGGVTVDYTYTSISLGNGSDGLELAAGTTTLDEISWDDGATFPDPAGASMSLHSNNTDDADNDEGAFWCEAQSQIGTGDYGTPGAANDACGESIDTHVQAIFTADCKSCHSSPNPSKNLELDSGNAWDAMYEVSSSQSSTVYLVDPGASSNSWIVSKVEGTQSTGVQMPKGSSALSAADIQSIKDWIDDGAWK